MTDPHIHVLNGLDDGSHKFADSLAILRELSALGFTDVICTPHYIVGSKYNANNLIKADKMAKLQSAVNDAQLGINLHLGNEIFIDTDIPTLIKLNKAKAISQKYILFEMPFNNYINDMDILIKDIKRKGLRPIVAHPERYVYFQKNHKLAEKFKKLGVAFQCNYGSITGLYGPDAEKTIRYFLKNDMVTFLGTDIHHPDSDIVKCMPKIRQRIMRLIGKDGYAKIMRNNDLLVK